MLTRDSNSDELHICYAYIYYYSNGRTLCLCFDLETSIALKKKLYIGIYYRGYVSLNSSIKVRLCAIFYIFFFFLNTIALYMYLMLVCALHIILLYIHYIYICIYTISWIWNRTTYYTILVKNLKMVNQELSRTLQLVQPQSAEQFSTS